VSGYLFDTDVLSLLSPGGVNVPEGFGGNMEEWERVPEL
jgi:hypothetical protein